MSSIKKSVMLGKNTQKYISARFRKEHEQDVFAWSQGLNGAVSTLQFVLANSLPDLTEKEWFVVLNVFNGTMWDDERIESFLSIATRMMDDVGAIDVNQLDPDYKAIVIKMHGLSAVEQYAVSDMCRKFWANRQEAAPLLEMIEKLKGL